jgi:tetratricopeptide (TPR) repeat protein
VCQQCSVSALWDTGTAGSCINKGLARWLDFLWHQKIFKLRITALDIRRLDFLSWTSSYFLGVSVDSKTYFKLGEEYLEKGDFKLGQEYLEKACFKLGQEYLEEGNYIKANEMFWKVMEQIHAPEQVELFREKASVFDPEVTAVFLQGTLAQVLG